METIFTINARGNCLLEVTADYFKLSSEQIFNEINGAFQKVVDVLKKKGVNYNELKSCLTPSTDRCEIIFVFNTEQISSSCYGDEIFERIIPLFDRRSSHSVLCGDYIDVGKESSQEMLYEKLSSEISLFKKCHYVHSSQFFFVYVNNLSNEMIESFNNGLKDYLPYVGFIDVSCSSFMKTYSSMILCNIFIKSKNVIIMGHEDDLDESRNVNVCGYPFEENNYKFISLPSYLFGVFLSYKIERQVFPGFSRDTDFSINAISKNVLAITDFEVEIEPKKLRYLLESKTGKMKKAGLINLSPTEIEELIRQKISSNYIYNLTYLKEHNTIKFNIIVEKCVADINETVRLAVSLEYIPSTKILRLITMF
jgi:hypothetical protein